jgi:formate hydrogenlyase subunit 3/multisubunit Na+/H+ antiporter MnhD subunit
LLTPYFRVHLAGDPGDARPWLVAQTWCSNARTWLSFPQRQRRTVHPLSTALIAILCVPLLLGKVAPNGYYGFRTAKTMSSHEIWYVANRFAAINLIVASVVGLVLADDPYSAKG